MSCISCIHCRLVPPVGWRPAYEGQRYPAWQAELRIEAGGGAQRLMCTLWPEWREYDTDHFCGQWAPEGGLGEVMRRGNMVRVMERARGEADREVKELRRRLRASREVSAKRLARLRNGADGGL